jgi:hypothetical protein
MDKSKKADGVPVSGDVVNSLLVSSRPEVPTEILEVMNECGALIRWIGERVDTTPLNAALKQAEEEAGTVLGLDAPVSERAARLVQLNAEIMVLRSDLAELPKRRFDAGMRAFEAFKSSRPKVMGWVYSLKRAAFKGAYDRFLKALESGLSGNGVELDEKTKKSIEEQAARMAEAEEICKHWDRFEGAVARALKLDPAYDSAASWAGDRREQWIWAMNPFAPLSVIHEGIPKLFEEAVGNLPPATE